MDTKPANLYLHDARPHAQAPVTQQHLILCVAINTDAAVTAATMFHNLWLPATTLHISPLYHLVHEMLIEAHIRSKHLTLSLGANTLMHMPAGTRMGLHLHHMVWY